VTVDWQPGLPLCQPADPQRAVYAGTIACPAPPGEATAPGRERGRSCACQLKDDQQQAQARGMQATDDSRLIDESDADAAAGEALPAAPLSQRFKSMFDAVPDAVTVLDEDGCIVEANARACQVFGRTHADLLGISVYTLNPALRHDRIREVIDQHGDGLPFVHDTTNVRADGTSFPVEVHSKVFIHDGRPYVVAVARDVSAREAVASELRASEGRYRQLLQAMDKGVIVHDGRGRAISVNPAACRILGRSESELLDPQVRLDDWEFVDVDNRPISPDHLPSLRALREGKTIESATIGVMDLRQRRYTWVAVTATPLVRDGEPEPFSVISTFSDVSELKRDSELFLQTQELSQIGGWEWDPVAARMYFTAPLYRLLDLPADSQVDLSTLIETVQPQDRPQAEMVLRAAERQGGSFDIECRVRTGRGRRRWIRLLGEGQHRNGDVFRVVGTVQDITKDKLTQATLRQQALTDPLTGLPNRDSIVDRIGTAIAQAVPGDGPAVLHVDLDRFKVVNDLLGHHGGDALLRAAGERLVAAVGGGGIAARFGGDEFLVLSPVGGTEKAAAIAQRIAQAFSAPFTYADEEFSITSSIGLACYPDDASTVQQLLQNADAAMFEAKRRGRNTWQAFNPALARQMADRLVIETQLRRALENREFRLEYQPQVDLASGRMIAVEALLRWDSRLLGPMNPDVFIPYAETTGDIVRIGAWVLHESCRQLKEWREGGLDLERVAVNVSFRQFLSEDFEKFVLAALHEHGLPGSALELEITERVLIEDSADTLHTLRELKSHGVLISIDDFGEGFSALNYLRRLPIDGVKISHGFMRGIPDSPADAVICRSIIHIARSLGLTVIGEGVETTAQRDFLIDGQAELAQGYLFSAPLAPAAVPGYRPPER
jgi:diguanylate cyclase (GGDEF)-like protein/PAS domain S-box-containing protein